MKIAVVGKGGVGKTFVAGTLARLSKELGEAVIAIDADPATSLYLELGMDPKAVSAVTPISENQTLIQEKTGVTAYDSASPVFNLNPPVDDVVEKYAIESPEGIKLLIMGTVRNAGKGCMCPANALLRALLRHVFAKLPATVIIDVEAGLEPFGRGTIQYVDGILNIMEPSMQSIETSVKIHRLATELGIRKHLFIANKVAGKDEQEFVERSLAEHEQKLELIIPYDESIRLRAIRKGSDLSHLWKDSPAVNAIAQLASRLHA